MSDLVLIALIAALPLVLAQVAVLYTTHKTHKLVNSKMTDALKKIADLEGEIRGLREAPPKKAKAHK
jgi:cell division protein FtsL